MSAAAADHTKLNGHLWQVYSLASAKGEVMPLVRRQLTVLTDGLAKPHGQDAHRQLCALTADLFQLAGEIFFDANAYTNAAHCYTLAAQASTEADAFDLWACAMISPRPRSTTPCKKRPRRAGEPPCSPTWP